MLFMVIRLTLFCTFGQFINLLSSWNLVSFTCINPCMFMFSLCLITFILFLLFHSSLSPSWILSLSLSFFFSGHSDILPQRSDDYFLFAAMFLHLLKAFRALITAGSAFFPTCCQLLCVLKGAVMLCASAIRGAAMWPVTWICLDRDNGFHLAALWTQGYLARVPGWNWFSEFLKMNLWKVYTNNKAVSQIAILRNIADFCHSNIFQCAKKSWKDRQK